MEQKTKINAEAGKQELLITRDFDLPLELLFRAYTEAGLLEQWMGTKVLKLECKAHGSYRYETSDAQGKVLFSANGVIHACIPQQKIIRTFEMENAPLGVQLEICTFEKLTEDTCRLSTQIIYESVALRDMQLQMPFAAGLNYAHDRLQNVMNKLK